MRSIHNPTGTPHGPGQIGVSSVESLRLAARQSAGSEPLRSVARLDARACTPGGIRRPEWWETGLSEAEALYLTREHVLGKNK